jgi:hypothetical protein
MKRFNLVLAILIAVFAATACSKSTSTGGTANPNPNPSPNPTPTVTPIINLPQGWYYSSTLTGNAPTGLQFFTFDSIFAGRKTKAFCLAFDTKLNRFDFKPVLSATTKTPTAFYNDEPGITYAAINGGYFGSPNQSFSLVEYNNVVSSANIKALTRTFMGNPTSYFPTRAAFGVDASGAPNAAWIYNTSADNQTIYSYPTVSPNMLNVAPQPVPTASFPAGGSLWNMSAAIGGSPMLIKNSVVTITDNEELISINNTTSRPRTAIGHNNNGIIIIVVVEGDNTAAGYAGLNLVETATLMQNLGCTNAINLDGGGSTSMVVRGNLTVRPGDGTERAVISAILIKQK